MPKLLQALSTAEAGEGQTEGEKSEDYRSFACSFYSV